MNEAEKNKLYSPLRLFIIIALVIFGIEMGIMIAFHYLRHFSELEEAIIDPVILSVVLFPVLYFLMYRPMKLYIDKLRQTGESLQAEMDKLNTIYSGSQDAIVMMDGTGVITFWNPASEKMFGYARDEALERNLHELIVPERFRNDALKGLQTFKDTGEGPLIGVMLEHAGLRKNGTEFYAEHSISALKIKGEWHALGIIRDITERKQKETVIRDLLEKTEQGQKELLERIDDLERFRKATVQREFRIKELRDENEELKKRLGIHKT